MVQQINGKEVKEKIRKYLEEKGPSLPIPIAKHISMSTLFASAFLSEMSEEGMVRISNMKVGGSPLYYTSSKLEMLENFTKFLGEKQREAVNMLKEQSILQDDSLHPAIRVALRTLKDFAIPFKNDSRVFWRYFKVSEDKVRELLNEKVEKLEIKKEEIKAELKAEEKPKAAEKALEDLSKEIEDKKRDLEKMNQQLTAIIKARKKIKPILPVLKKPAKKNPKKIDERFLNEVKEILARKQFDVINLENFDAKEVTARISMNNQEHLLIAYNKKKIGDSEIIKAYKKASSLSLPYYIISKGETSKKTKESMEAFKKLAAIDKIEAPEEKPELSNINLKKSGDF